MTAFQPENSNRSQAQFYMVSVNVLPFRFWGGWVVDHYEDKIVAERVAKVFQTYFMPRILGGVDVTCTSCKGAIVETPEGWRLEHDLTKKIETLFDKIVIQARMDSFTEYAKGVQVPVIDFDLNSGQENERLEGIWDYDYFSEQEDTDQELRKKPQEIDHKAELLKLGFAPFKENQKLSKVELRTAYKKWARAHHPDKKPEGPERDAADHQFKIMKNHYDALMENFPD